MDTIIAFFETVWLVIEVSFWVSLACLGLILVAALRKALRPRRAPAPAPRAAPAAPSSAFSPTSAKSIAAARRWWYSEDVEAPFKWGRDIGYPRGKSHPGQSPLSFGGGRPYNGEDGPLGFTTRDTDLVGAYLAAGYRFESESHAWVIEATDGFEWELDHDVPGKWVCYQREW
jgi:hypothetical protein